MSTALRKPMTQAEFFVWAEQQDGHYEFDGFGPVPKFGGPTGMVGGTIRHARLAGNIFFEVRSRLKGGPCEPFGSDSGVATTGSQIRYPEVTVTCTRGIETDRLVPNPVVVFEVLSDSTRRIDQVFKLREYLAVPSICRYVLVEQIGVGLTVHLRGTDGLWQTTVLGGGDVLGMPEIGIELPVAAIYDGVTFDDQPRTS